MVLSKIGDTFVSELRVTHTNWLKIRLEADFRFNQFLGLVIGILFLFLFHICKDDAGSAIISYTIRRNISISKTKFYFTVLISISTIIAFYEVSIILNIF